MEGPASNTSYDGNRLGCTVAVECVDTMRQQELCNYSVRVSNMFSQRDPEFITVLDMSQPSVQALQRIQ